MLFAVLAVALVTVGSSAAIYHEDDAQVRTSVEDNDTGIFDVNEDDPDTEGIFDVQDEPTEGDDEMNGTFVYVNDNRRTNNTTYASGDQTDTVDDAMPLSDTDDAMTDEGAMTTAQTGAAFEDEEPIPVIDLDELQQNDALVLVATLPMQPLTHIYAVDEGAMRTGTTRSDSTDEDDNSPLRLTDDENESDENDLFETDDENDSTIDGTTVMLTDETTDEQEQVDLSGAYLIVRDDALFGIVSPSGVWLMNENDELQFLV